MDEKQLVEKAYEAIEVAKTSGKLKKGTNETTKAVEKGMAKLVVAAKDTNPPEIVMHLTPLCKERKVPFVIVPSKEELGRAAGLPLASSAITVVAEGDAKDLIKQIADAVVGEHGGKEAE